MTVLGEKKIELALYEFKAANNATIIRRQEGKTIRLSHCVLEEMKEKDMSPNIMAFTWGRNIYACTLAKNESSTHLFFLIKQGNTDEMFVLEEKNDLFAPALVIKIMISSLLMFVRSMSAL